MNNKHYVGRHAKSVSVGNKLPPVSKVSLSGDNDALFEVGDDTGYTLKVFVPTATRQMAQNIYNQAKGFRYQGFTAENAFVPPTIELGDGITAGGAYGILAFRDYKFTPKMSETLKAPLEEEKAHEYEYTGTFEKELKTTLKQGAIYYGTRITRKSGLEIVKVVDEEEKSRVVLNSETLAFYNNDGEAAFYYDANTGTFKLSQHADVEDALTGSQAFMSMSFDMGKFEVALGDAEGNISELQQTTTALSSSLTSLNGNVSTLQQTTDGLSSTITNINGQISTINQTIDGISLDITGSLGSKASIVLKTGTKTYTNTLDLTGVRSAFANDASEVTISGGKVTFNAGTFVVNSVNLQIDKNGNLTTNNGTITGATITGSTLTSEQGNSKIIIREGHSEYYRQSISVGHIGTNTWLDSTGAYGIAFELDPGGAYMAWGNSESRYYASKLLYTNQSLYDPVLHGYFQPDTLYLSCNTMCTYRLDFGYDYSYPAGNIWYYHDYSSPELQINATDTLVLNANYIDTSVDVFSLSRSSLVQDSDERLKTNIQPPSTYALEVLRNTKLYQFDWIETNEHVDLGFIAQQLGAESSPSFMNYSSIKDRYSVNLLAMIPYLVKAVQELYDILNPETVSLLSDNIEESWQPGNYTLQEKEAYIAKEQALVQRRKAFSRPKPKEDDLA